MWVVRQIVVHYTSSVVHHSAKEVVSNWGGALSPAHTMRFLSSVGRRDDEKTIVAWCVRTKDNCRPLILQTRQLLDRFEKRIGPTTVAWCVRVKDICRINRPATDQSQ